MTPTKNFKDVSKLVFKTIAFAMGIAVIVLQTLGAASAGTSVTLLGIGLLGLALGSL